jgi:hypothetical protein
VFSAWLLGSFPQAKTEGNYFILSVCKLGLGLSHHLII